MNRGARRARLFDSASDYLSFLSVLAEARERIDLRLLAYCVMPNHYHLVVWPRENDELPKFMWWFQTTHGKRWHGFRGTRGTGAVYQSRYRAFAVQTDGHFFSVCRYVERNALRAGLVKRAEDWAWSSLFERCKNCNRVRLDAWPISQPDDWIELVNQAQTDSELESLRQSVHKNAPYGGQDWTKQTATALNMVRSLRPLGRPRK